MVKIPLVIHRNFWWVACLLAVILQPDVLSQGIVTALTHCLLWVGVILVSLLVHEYGHALTASYFGQQARIEIVGFWGLTFRKGNKLSGIKEFFVVLNGPLMSFFLYLLCDGMQGFFSDKEALMPFIITSFRNINLFWTLTNLLPIYPLDGGQLLKILMGPLVGVKALRYTSFLSILFAGVLALVAMFLGFFFMGAMFMMLAFEASQSFMHSKDLVQEDTQETYQKRLEEAILSYQENDRELAKNNLVLLRKELRGGKLYTSASFLLSKIYQEEKKGLEAIEVLKSVESHLDAEGLHLFQAVLYSEKDYLKALKIGQKAFRETPKKDVALINAYCSGQLKLSKEAVGWLNYLSTFSDVGLKTVLNHPSFNAIRQEPIFMRFLQHKFPGK